MAKQLGAKFNTRHVSFEERIFCASNGQPCSGICREKNLKNSRTGTCISAYNLPKAKRAFRRVWSEGPSYDQTDKYALWQHMDEW